MKKISLLLTLFIVSIFSLQIVFAEEIPHWIEDTWTCIEDCDDHCAGSITYYSCMTICEDNNEYHGCVACPEGTYQHPESGNCVFDSDESCQSFYGPGAIYDGNSIDGCTCAEGATWDGLHCVWPEVTQCPEGQVVHPDSGNCIWSSTTWCSIAYGEAVYDGNSIDGCACIEGATWNGSQCVLDSCFSDTVDHYYATAICYVKDNGIVQGYDDGTFRPDNYINRAEFMKIIMSASYDSSLLTGSYYCFDDIGAEWYADYICPAFDMGIIDGYPDGTFHPEYLINLAEALKIIFEAAGVTISDTGGTWYDPYINTANSIGLLNTINSDPGHLLTRGEMAELIYVSETQI